MKITDKIAKHKPNNSVMKIWAVSYTAIFVIPLIVSILVYSMSSNMIRRQVHLAGELSLQNVKSQMDSEIIKIMNNSFEVRYQNDFAWLSEAESFARADAYKLKLAVESLLSTQVIKESIDTIYLHFKSSDIVVSSINTQSADRYYDYNYHEFPTCKDEWLTLIRGDYQKGRIEAIRLDKQNHSRTEIYFIKSTQSVDSRYTYNTMVRFSNKALSAIFNSKTIFEDCILAMLDENGNILYSPHRFDLPPDISERVALSPLNGGGVTETRINDIPYVVIHAASDVIDVNYLLMVSQEAFYTQYAAMRYMIFVVVGLALLVGIFVIILALRINYNPLRRLMSTLRSDDFLDLGESKGNEFQRISRAIESLHSEKSEADRILYQKDIALRRSLISRMLHGIEQFGLTTAEAMEQHGVCFESEFFAVVSVAVDDMNISRVLDKNEMFEDELQRTHIARRRVSYVSENMIGELLAEFTTCYSTVADGMVSVLLNLPANDLQAYKTAVNSAAGTITSLMQENFGTTLTVAASNILSGMPNIPEAYSQIAYTLEYSQSFEDNQAVFYVDIEELSTGSFYYSIATERQLAALYETGNTADICALVNEIFDRNTGEYNINTDIAKFLASNILGTLFKSPELSPSRNNTDLMPTMKNAATIHSSKSVEEVRARLLEILEQYFSLSFDAGKQSCSRGPESVCEQIESYVHENYADQNLSVSTLAEALGLNAAYTSRIMRRVHGIGLLDYINSHRITKAKQLLLSSEDYTVEDVASRVGFATSKTFTRCFKKYAGTTPGKFKDERYSD